VELGWKINVLRLYDKTLEFPLSAMRGKPQAQPLAEIKRKKEI